MKKTHFKKIIRSTLCEIVKEESDSEKLLNMKIKNPETGDDIKLKSALAYDKSSQVYKVAKSTHDKAMQVIKKDSEKSSQDTPASEPSSEPETEKEKAEKAEKAEFLSAFDDRPGVGGSYADMMKKSDSEIEKGNITKDTLPSYKPPNYRSAPAAQYGRKEYDKIVDKAWDKDKEATRDALINRMYDVNDSPEAQELKDKLETGEGTPIDKHKLQQMTSTGLDDLEYLKNKVGEKNLMFHVKRIKKERDYEKKSGIGKFFSKLGLSEEDNKNLPKLKDLIKR